MPNFDVESLFTNITLQETVYLCVERFINDKRNIDGSTITGFHELFNVTMSESLVLFDSKYYKQIHGVAMGSPLGPTFANVFFLFIMNKFGSKVVHVILNLAFIKDILMTPPCYFD